MSDTTKEGGIVHGDPPQIQPEKLLPHSTSNPVDMKQATLDLAEKGFRVFPVLPLRKNPHLEKNLILATTDAEQIERWWSTWPTANIGIATEGLLVLDIDDPSSEFMTPEKWADLQGAPTSSTPRGGSHYWFRQPEGADVRSFETSKTFKIDIRANGGYVVAPPSVTSGRFPKCVDGRYSWNIEPESADDLPLPPEWLLDFALKRDRQSTVAPSNGHTPTGSMRALERQADRDTDAEWKKAVAALAALPPDVVDGRDSWRDVGFALHSIRPDAVGLRAWETWSQGSAKFTPGECERQWASFRNDKPNGIGIGTLLHMAKITHLEPPPEKKIDFALPEEEIQTEEIKQKPGRTVGPMERFPLTVLPAPLPTFIRTGSKALGVDPVMVAFPLLASVAAVIGNRRRLQAKRGWEEPPNLYACIIGESASGKTPAHDLALKPIRRLQGFRVAAFRDAMADYRHELSEWEKASKTSRGEKPEPPIPSELYASSFTKEAVEELLYNNPAGILAERDELSGWLASFGQYKNGNGDDEQFFLSAYGSCPVKVNRKTGIKMMFIPAASLSICGGVQPAVFARCLGTRDRQENGLLQRFILGYPQPGDTDFSEDEIPEDAVGGIVNLLEKIIGLPVEDSEDGERFSPRIIRLGADAKAAFIEYHDALGDEIHGSKTSLERSLLSKMRATALRLALLVHTVKEAMGTARNPYQVDLETMQAGITLATWAKNEALRNYALLGGATVEEGIDLDLLRWIGSKGGDVPVRDIYRSLDRYETREKAVAACKGLQAAGYGELYTGDPGPKGGNPPFMFRLTQAHRHRHNPEKYRKKEVVAVSVDSDDPNLGDEIREDEVAI